MDSANFSNPHNPNRRPDSSGTPDLEGQRLFAKRIAGDYCQSWQPEGPQPVAAYRQERPSIGPRIRQILAAEIAPGQKSKVLLEMGAGAGAGNAFLGALPENVILLETDSRTALLQVPRPNKSLTIRVSYPQAPMISAATADSVFGIDFFNTLSSREMAAILPEALRALKPGGTLYMIVDVPPLFSTELRNARAAGEVVFPLSVKGEGGELEPSGLLYLKTGDFEKICGIWEEGHSMSDLRRFHSFLSQYRYDPLHTLARRHFELPQYLPMLMRICEERNFETRTVTSISELVLKRLANAAKAAGFEAVKIGQDDTREENGVKTLVSWVSARKAF